MATALLLPPVTAVRMAWALTGAFANDEHSKQSAVIVENALKDIRERAQSDPMENKYVISALATLDACRRSLDTVYKGRNLNFDENEKLRTAYLDSVKEGIEFGKKAQAFVKSIPAMTISAATGVTVAQALKLNDLNLWAVGLVLAAVGYLINLYFVRWARDRTQQLYVSQDYERNIYYDQYITRVDVILTSLYLDLNRIHKNVFGSQYPLDGIDAGPIVDEILRGVRPLMCSYVHKHTREKKITPELWPLCETGASEAVKACKWWEGKAN